MIILETELSDYRNYAELHLTFGSGVHLIYGDNAQGKSNLIEAMYLSLTGKSYRSAKDREIISFDKEEAHIKTMVRKNETDYRIDMHLKAGRSRGIAVNRVPVKKMKEFIGLFGAVIFSPEDLQIVKNGPEERRRFIDTELSTTSANYLHAYQLYKKALEQRNKLLKDIPLDEKLYETLDIWDESLLTYGKEIIRERGQFLREIAPIVRKKHSDMTGGKETLTVSYEPNVEEGRFERELKNARTRDLRARTTTVGPHRDDIGFQIEKDGVNPIDVRTFGSQGQQRTAALSLKLSEIDFLRQKTGDDPVLFLDDVFSELDGERQQCLIDTMSELQTFITCTGIDDFVARRVKINNVYRITNGAATHE